MRDFAPVLAMTLVMAVAVAACGSGDSSPTTLSPGASTTLAPVTQPTAPSTTLAGSSSTSSTPTTVSTPTSAESLTWQRVPSPTGNPYFVGATAAGPQGVVAIGTFKPAGAAATDALLFSTDGLTWDVTLEVGSRATLHSITAWSGGFVAGGLIEDPTTRMFNAAVWTSADGLTFERVVLESPQAAATTLTGSDLSAAVSALYTAELIQYPGASVNDIHEINGNLLAVGYALMADGHHGAAWQSPDGSTWTAVADQPAFVGEPDASMDEITVKGDRVVVSGAVGGLITQAMWSSKDEGSTWVRTPGDLTPGGGPSSGHGSPLEVVVFEDEFIALLSDVDGAATVWTSQDGATWRRSATLADDGTFVTSVVATSDGLLAIGDKWDGSPRMWQSPNGSEWSELSLPPEVFRATDTPVHAASVNGTVLVYGIDEGETFGAVQWVGRTERVADSWNVVLVANDDVLNARAGPGTSNEIIATLGPLSGGWTLSGASESVDGSTWVEVLLADGESGWVNRHFLSPDHAAPSVEEAALVITAYADALLAESELVRATSERGLYVVHFDDPRWYRTNELSSLVSDPALEVWPDGARDPAETPPATFAEAVAGPFAAAVQNPESSITVNAPPPRQSWLIPGEFQNFHFVAIHTPAPSGQPEDFAWQTWFAFIDYELGQPKVVALMADRWIP